MLIRMKVSFNEPHFTCAVKLHPQSVWFCLHMGNGDLSFNKQFFSTIHKSHSTRKCMLSNELCAVVLGYPFWELYAHVYWLISVHIVDDPIRFLRTFWLAEIMSSAIFWIATHKMWSLCTSVLIPFVSSKTPPPISLTSYRTCAEARFSRTTAIESSRRNASGSRRTFRTTTWPPPCWHCLLCRLERAGHCKYTLTSLRMENTDWPTCGLTLSQGAAKLDGRHLREQGSNTEFSHRNVHFLHRLLHRVSVLLR